MKKGGEMRGSKLLVGPAFFGFLLSVIVFFLGANGLEPVTLEVVGEALIHNRDVMAAKEAANSLGVAADPSRWHQRYAEFFLEYH